MKRRSLLIFMATLPISLPSFGFNSDILQKLASAKKRAKRKAEDMGLPPDGMKMKLIPKPESRRVTLTESFNFGVSETAQVKVTAIGLDSGNNLNVKVWKTSGIFGENTNLGKGPYVDFTYKSGWLGRSRLKVSCSGKEDAAILFSVFQ